MSNAAPGAGASANGAPAAGGKPSSLLFPVLSFAELLTCLSELSLPLTKDDLVHPTEEAIRPVIEGLVKMLKGKGEQEKMEPLMTEHDSIPEAGRLKECLELLSSVSVGMEVTLSDLVAPTKERNKRVLSALINFAKFREEKQELFQQANATSQQLMAQMAELETRANEMEMQRAALEATAAEVQPQRIIVQQEADAAKAQLDALIEEQKTVREEIKKQKEALQTAQTQLQDTHSRLATQQDEIKKTRGQIVHEPEKHKAQLQEMTDQMKSGRALLSSQNAKLKALQLRSANFDRVLDKVVSRKDLMQSGLGEGSNVHKLRRSQAEQAEQARSLEASVSELAAQEDTLKENMAQASDKLFALQTQFESRRVTAQAALAEVQAGREALERQKAEQIAAQQQYAIAVAKARALVEQEQARAQSSIAHLRAGYGRLQNSVADYHHNLHNAIAHQQHQQALQAAAQPVL